ncbi:MAG: hypothetical protein RJA45_663 [Actinomycetota bacterium]
MFRRVLSMLLVVGLALAIGLWLKLPEIQVGVSPAAQSIKVQPKEPTLVCPGPVFVNGGQSGVTLGSFTQSGTVTISGHDDTSTINLTATGEKLLTGHAVGSKGFNAVQGQFANGQQAFGLAAANCVPGANQAWLVAGDNSIGREALLVLANASSVDATVSLQLYGTSGPIQGAGLSGISAPAGKVTVLPLSSFAPKAETFAIQVTSRGAELGIWLQQKTVRGLTPGGLDLVGVSAEPAETVLIPGVFLRNSAALSNLASANKDFADTKPILRVTAPGDVDANFTAQIQGADGASFGNVLQGTVPAGSTRDFALEDLTDGNYSVQISSDQPVLGAVRYSRLSGSLPDFAWAQAVAPTKLDAGFTALAGATTKLSIVNGGKEKASYTVQGVNYSIAANSNVVVTVTAGTRYSIRSSQPLAVSQVIDIKGGVGVVPILDYQNVGGTLKVLVR